MSLRTVIGRDDELAALEAFLAEVARGPAALAISGEAGIGKTVLWETAVERAGPPVGRVLSYRAAETESQLSFSGLSELVTPVLPEVAARLAPPRRNALEVALLLAEPGGQAADARAIGLGFLDVLRLLAERSPAVVAVDDLQWLDGASRGALEMALRRLRHERVGLLATAREAAEAVLPSDFERSLPAHRLTRLSLGPLSLAELRALLAERLALELARPELVRLHEACSGNPFLALELARELEREGLSPGLGIPLPVPGGLRTLLGGRLARLSEETRDVLLTAAAAGRATVDVIAAADDDEQAAREALSVAVREGLISFDGPRIRFAHPLLASVCYEEAPPWRRRAVHRALGDAVTDVEERARHLALAAEGPDLALASDLEAAAERAAARGAPAAASELFELSASLTPADETGNLRRHYFRAAELHIRAGNPERAGVLFQQLVGEVPPGRERADALFGLATTRPADPAAFSRLLEEALAEASGDDVRSARILAFRAQIAFTYAGPGGSLPDARAALEQAERAGDPALLATAIARVGQVETYTMDVTPGLLERGVAIEERLDRALALFDSPSAMLAVRVMLRDEPERARPLLERAGANAVDRGDEGERAWVLFYLMWLEWLVGRWQLAADHLAEAMELARQTQLEFLWPQVLNQQAFLDAYRGRVEQARTKAGEALAIFEQASSEIHTIVCRSTLGHLELALGNLEAADRHLRALPGGLLSLGWNEPSHPLWSDTIETMIALGELEPARALLEQYEQLARRASRLSQAGAARCRALLASAEGDHEIAFAAFERSLAELEALPYPFERARTLLALGGVRRRARQKRLAREALEQALAVFEELDARLWAERAQTELRRISGRRPASAELTESEQQAARLAMEGRSNKEIAAALHISVHTVEAQLSRVYRKLGVRSRAELSSRLSAAAENAAKVAETAFKE